jgi:hypothetical protein
LTAGTYRFSIPAQARSWQVTRTSFSVLVDNSAHGCAVHCESDGQPRTIRAGPKGAFRVDGLAPGSWQVLSVPEEIVYILKNNKKI